MTRVRSKLTFSASIGAFVCALIYGLSLQHLDWYHELESLAF